MMSSHFTMCMYVRMNVCMYVCMHVCMYVYMSYTNPYCLFLIRKRKNIHTYIHVHTHKDIDMMRKRKDIHTYIHTHTHKDIDTFCSLTSAFRVPLWKTNSFTGTSPYKL